jgi:hypothetical protein
VNSIHPFDVPIARALMRSDDRAHPGFFMGMDTATHHQGPFAWDRMGLR